MENSSSGLDNDKIKYYIDNHIKLIHPKPFFRTDISLLLGPVGVGVLSLNPGFVNQPLDPFMFMEACVAKSVLSMVMGGAMVCYSLYSTL